MIRAVAAAAVVLNFSLLLSATAWGRLGEPYRPGQKSIAKPGLSPPGCVVVESVNPAHVIREYVGPSGIVFAVVWRGLTHPDSTELLGRYAGQYHQALEQSTPPPGRKPVRVSGSQVVVEKWGHMRNLQGRAYLPHLIPPGVTADAIR